MYSFTLQSSYFSLNFHYDVKEIPTNTNQYKYFNQWTPPPKKDQVEFSSLNSNSSNKIARKYAGRKTFI